MKHKWTGPVDDRTCKNCGVRRKTINGIFKYKQWWGGWDCEYPKCGSIGVQKAAWERRHARSSLHYEMNKLKEMIAAALSVNVDEENAARKMVAILSGCSNLLPEEDHNDCPNQA
jgi:hypothetical protein